MFGPLIEELYADSEIQEKEEEGIKKNIRDQVSEKTDTDGGFKNPNETKKDALICTEFINHHVVSQNNC